MIWFYILVMCIPVMAAFVIFYADIVRWFGLREIQRTVQKRMERNAKIRREMGARKKKKWRGLFGVSKPPNALKLSLKEKQGQCCPLCRDQMEEPEICSRCHTQFHIECLEEMTAMYCSTLGCGEKIRRRRRFC